MKTPALLPERHPEKDFFIADIFDSIPVKDDIHTMEHPFFSVDQKPKLEETIYNRNGIEIKISPHHKLGLPTMNDKDILLYCSSLVMAELNKGRIPPRTMRFSAHDLLVTTNRDTSGRGYAYLKNAFDRLTGCLINTNIKTTELEMYAGFHILERFGIVRSSKDGSRMVELEVTLSDWLYRSLLRKEVLSINRDYFRLRKPLERRIYELARKHCGNQELWEIRLENLKEKIGSTSDLRKFRHQVKQIIETNKKERHFPDYNFLIDNKDILTFSHKEESTVKPMRKPDYVPPPAFDADEELGLITTQTQIKVHDMAKDANYDFDYLVDEFKAFMKRKGKPKNVNGAFMNFARKKTNHIG